MEEMENGEMKAMLNTIFAAVCSAFTYFFGGWDVALAVLITFMVFDYLTGVIIAIINKKLSSAIGFKGLAKKLFIIVILVVGVLLDRLINSGEWIFRTLVAYFYIANEGISIVENIAVLGVPVPEKIIDILEQIKEKHQDDETDENE